MGIDPERFVYAVPQDSFCVLCSSVLQDPVEVIKCGHYVCSSCWDTWIHNDIDGKCKSESKIVTCPYCGIDIDIGGIRKSKITWNLIQNMNVYCTHKSAGCESIYKLGFDDLHSKNCVYQQDGMDTGKLEKCDTCNLTITENLRSHSCVKELLQNIKQQSTGITNLEHENNRLTFKLTTFEKEFMEERAELEGQFFEESLKYGKEIRDLRTRLACLQGELSRRKGQSEVENLTIELERVNGSLGFNIIGGATKDDRLSSGIYVSRIVEGGAADGPGKLQLHDCILEVDGVNLRNATHELAVKTFRNSGNPFKMVIQRIINKVHSCDAETQTFGVAFAVTGENDQIDKPVRSFQNNKSRWLTPHEIADSAHLSGSDECVSVIPQNNKEEQRKNDDYDSAYDTLLTQKSFRSTRSPSLNENSDSSCTTLKTTTSPDCSETHSVVLRTKVTSTDSDNRRHSTFYVIPSEEQKNADNKSWEDIQTCGENEAEYEYEYEEVSLRKEEGKLGMVLCYGGDEKDVAVYIGDLEDNSVADISGKVMVGDQIVQINGTQVMNVEQAYSMLQQSDEITLVVARAVYENHTDYYDEAEETDLDMLDCINEEAESVFSKESSPMYASSNSSKSSSPKVNRKTGGDGSSPVSPLSSTVPSSETGRERAMTLSPVNSSSNEDFQLPERRSRSISVNDNGSIDEKLERQRNSSAENKNEKESNIKSSLKNFVKTRLGSSEKKGRSSSHSDESCELNKIPRCDSNSSNNSNRSKHSSEKENSLSPQEQLKARLKEQRNQSKMKAYLDSPSLQRHRVNNNNMFVNQNGFSLVNSPANFSGKMMNVPVFTPVNMPHKNMTQFHPGMFHGMPTFVPNHPGLVPFNMPGTQHPLRAQNGMNASVSSLRSAMKNSTMNNNNMYGKAAKPKKVQIDPHPGWNETERRVWEEFKIIQSMESKENGTKDTLNVDPAKVEAEWRVRRSKDGKHVYIKKTNSSRNRVLKERAQQINDERCGMTTDDDAFTVYHGQYWNRDQRKKQLNRHNDRRKKLLEKAAIKAAFENKTEKAMAEMVQRKMTLPGVVFDNFITVEEILSQRNRSGVFEGPVHVTTI